MGGLRLQQLHGTVNSGPAVPAVRRAGRIIHPDDNTVFPGFQELCYIQPEGTVAILPASRFPFIHPYGAVFKNTAEIQIVAIAFLFFLQPKASAVPADSETIPEALSLPLIHIPAKRRAYGPVVGQGYRPIALLPVSIQCKFPSFHEFVICSWHFFSILLFPDFHHTY